MTFSELLDHYRRHLAVQVMPFWLKLTDREHGGVLNVVDDSGAVGSTEKWLWSQARWLWTCAALHRRQPAVAGAGTPPAVAAPAGPWLELARETASLLTEHGRDADGAWYFKLHRDGQPLQGPDSIYVDAFAIYGLTELFLACGDEQALAIARATFDRTSPLLEDHGSLATAPHAIPDGYRSHGPSMMFAYVYHRLGVAAVDDTVLARALELAEIVMTCHVRPDRQVLLEYVGADGVPVASDVGQTFIPGHDVESMWFMEEIYRHHGRQDRIELALQVMRWSLERGWDDTYGGLFLGRRTDGGEAVWHQPDAKVWWPHTEALFALLRAHELCGEPWCMDWYWRVHDYAFNHFPNPEHGDWHQNLDRQGHPVGVVVKNLGVKDPFHLPRNLIMAIDVLERLAA